MKQVRDEGLAILLVVAMLALVAGCGTASAGAPHTRDAASVVATLKAAGLPIGDSAAYTAATDPNALLGRPGQYVSKVNFWDSRVQRSSPNEITPGDGGSVETFANTTDAAARLKYVTALAASAPLFNEYDYQVGTVVLRLSHFLTPDQATQYQSELKKIAG